MADESNITLPDHDPDLALARKIGERLSSAASLSGLNDELTDLLTDYRNTAQQEQANTRPDSQSIWEEIRQATTSRPSTAILPFYKQAGFRAWAAAAAILIVAFVGIYWYMQPTESLIAQSGAAIEMVQLPDGSEVTLRPHSKITSIGKRNYIMEGEAYFSVIRDPGQPFSVEVGEAKITVMGTRFNASSWGSQSRVFLEEGSIRFEGLNIGESVILKPGQSSTLKNGRISSSDTAEANEFTDWINNTLVLKNSSFDRVLHEIEQHFNISINKADPAFEASGINGTYRLTSVDSTLRDIGLLVGGTFTRESKDTYLFETRE